MAIDLNIDDPKSVKSAAKIAVDGMMKYYIGNRTGQIPGLLPPPYYWWEAGAMFGTLVDYWYYTGNSEYNDVTMQALQFQVGPNNDFMPPNRTKDEGNDDQAFWAFAAMSAAENKFPDPPSSAPQWLALAQAVFNLQTTRWDTSTCNGGLRWQIFPFNNGYNYKNSISNGCFFNLAARLARYTGNTTYSDWAVKMWDWTEKSPLLDSKTYAIYDGSDVLKGCTDADLIRWTYNAGVYLHGAAVMWNHTQDQVWKTRVDKLLEATSVFFLPEPVDVMREAACEGHSTCNVDQRSFKAYLSRWYAATTQMANWTVPTIMPRLRTSAKAAAASCSEKPDGVTCGLKWTLQPPSDDGSHGVGEQMAALSVIQSVLIPNSSAPVTANSGGTSKGDPNAGGQGDQQPLTGKEVTVGDKVGAGFLTFFVLCLLLVGAWWMVV
ncbi:MAG: hydrolase 76 protein [Geoglossum umbratile]|nr:MAG: hydrolase 76 protein [Geoglossum umbratile]